MKNDLVVGVAGAGAMGSGIAEVAASAGHEVVIFDAWEGAAEKFETGIRKNLQRLVEKQKITEENASAIRGRIRFSPDIAALRSCGLIIEAIVENIDAKKKLFTSLEAIAGDECILASNTSSLSIASISAACKNPARVIGIHFFNPATIMPLVEIIPSISTSEAVVAASKEMITGWGKNTVVAKDTPGFIVNRIARPFYGEALRIYEEGIAGMEEIDAAMKTLGGFRMGPFELMDFIGNDINFAVTESVFREFWNDPRYKPSFTQKRLVEAGRLGRKTGRGYYDYTGNEAPATGLKDEKAGKEILMRILVMLINEAADALYLNIASRDDIDMAMTKGVNYPKGLLRWADETGIENCLRKLDELYGEYGEDRYRASVLLRKMVRDGKSFYN